MTVVVLAVIAVVLLLLGAAGALASVTIAAHRARAAADLGALAAASAGQHELAAGYACAWAAEVVQRNGGRLTACVPGGDGSVELMVECRPAGGLAGLGLPTARARSRAGPSG